MLPVATLTAPSLFGEPEEEVAGPVDNTGVDELIWGRR